MLAVWKFEISFLLGFPWLGFPFSTFSILLGFPLDSGTTRAVAKSRKMLCSILELIDLVKSGVKKPTAPFKCFGEIVSISVAFLQFNPWISFLFQFHLQNENKIFPLHEMKMSRNIYMQNTYMVFVGLDSFPNCFLNILIFVMLGDLFLFYSTTFFNNANILFIESFCKLSFAIYGFNLFSKLFSKNLLFARNGLIKFQKYLFVVKPIFVTLLRKDFMFFLLRETRKVRCVL